LAASTAFNFGITADQVEQYKASAEQKQKELDITNEISDLENQILSIGNRKLKLEQSITKEKEKQTQKTAKPGTILTDAFSASTSGLGQVSGPQFAPVFANARKEISQFEKRLVDFERFSSNIITNGILDGFRALGEGIANALTGADNALQGFANTVFAALGNFLTQLGEAAIATGIGMLALKNAFANPLAAIAAGTALVTAGALFNKASQSAPGGGLTGVGGQGSGEFTGSTNISRTGGFDGGGTVVFEIQGKKLVGVLNRTLKADRRTVADII